MAKRSVTLFLALTICLPPAPVLGDEPAQKVPGPFRSPGPEGKGLFAIPAPPEAWLRSESWQHSSDAPLAAGEIDLLLERERKSGAVYPAPLTTDEQFIRRVTLDLTGQLPFPADVTEFVADRNSNKRARLIDTLLASDEFARHWAGYWRDVITAHVTDKRGFLLVRAFDNWLFGQLKQNQGWDKIARVMLTAQGECRLEEDSQGGAFFLASHFGPDSAVEQAGETARIFLGIQLQCAQCHDHPTDQWKRVQFHELAGYFSRLRERPLAGGGKTGVELISVKRGEHAMPSRDDPKKTFLTPPRFLDGKSPGMGLEDADRRKALADAIVNGNDFWFSAAFVNRIWGELMGRAFTEPVDDMGPKREVFCPQLLARLSGAFRGSGYDVKAFFRAVMNSQAYQRQMRPGQSADEPHQFTATAPTRLRPDALYTALIHVLGDVRPGGEAKRPRPMGPFAFLQGFEGLVRQEFDFDPSARREEIEGSVPQALLMMNQPIINQRLAARGDNLLARILKSYPSDDAALQMVYLRTLARKPTDHELRKCRSYIRESRNRAEAYEDILWALLNSTEFLTRR